MNIVGSLSLTTFLLVQGPLQKLILAKTIQRMQSLSHSEVKIQNHILQAILGKPWYQLGLLWLAIIAVVWDWISTPWQAQI